MVTVLVLLVVLVAFALAAMRWGYDSRDGPESQEWKRREQSTWVYRDCPPQRSKCESKESARGAMSPNSAAHVQLPGIADRRLSLYSQAMNHSCS